MTESVLVDTSALYAALDADDHHHREAARGWERLLDGIESGEARGVTHPAVLVESTALVQRRLGMQATRALHDQLVATLDVHWIDEHLHRRAVAALLAAGRRDVSLVDWTSFEVMRELGLSWAFAFDEDFVSQGFSTWGPAPAAT